MLISSEVDSFEFFSWLFDFRPVVFRTLLLTYVLPKVEVLDSAVVGAK
jgi:hypothetical protein